MPVYEEDMPKWDIALAGLAKDEFRKKGMPLTLDDFRQLSRQHAIRLDDIMETLFLLAINGVWSYADSNGQDRPLGQETLDNLYVKRRLSEQELAAFNGSWRPA